ncbi:hypothetical protein [Lysobacter gummosus]|uniref:hypothetical protein n=1 Tax=Lysobacter gummosus TaxID=262324 RepID=UPI0036273CAE
MQDGFAGGLDRGFIAAWTRGTPTEPSPRGEGPRLRAIGSRSTERPNAMRLGRRGVGVRVCGVAEIRARAVRAYGAPHPSPLPSPEGSHLGWQAGEGECGFTSHSRRHQGISSPFAPCPPQHLQPLGYHCTPRRRLARPGRGPASRTPLRFR